MKVKLLVAYLLSGLVFFIAPIVAIAVRTQDVQILNAFQGMQLVVVLVWTMYMVHVVYIYDEGLSPVWRRSKALFEWRNSMGIQSNNEGYRKLVLWSWRAGMILLAIANYLW